MLWNRKSRKNVDEAKEDLHQTKKQLEEVREGIIEPARKIRQDDNFALIVRESLMAGHTKK